MQPLAPCLSPLMSRHQLLQISTPDTHSRWLDLSMRLRPEIP
ncbi:hypothetical protein [Synechococcus sp. WH 8020]|nr:hypothetical protein [Synechococcus sp. WH 8020]